tara:strand:- start:574 stop:1464 length:891 start_codon:yes stop_codon:yes gene_type:complete
MGRVPDGWAEHLMPLRESNAIPDKVNLLNAFGLTGGDFSWEGYMSENTTGKAELLVGGCSFTVGMGVKYEDSWGPRLSTLLGVESYVNISRVGWSSHAFATRMLNYMHVHGNPKYLAFLAPELHRAELLVNEETYKVEGGQLGDRVGSTLDMKPITLAQRNLEGFKPVKYSKSPHVIQEILPLEIAIQQSCTAISALLRYCEQWDIKVAWGSWDVSASDLFHDVAMRPDLPVSFTSYTDTPSFLQKNTPHLEFPENCHLELEELHGQNFTLGNDGRHAGVHFHAHWAEDLYHKLKS